MARYTQRMQEIEEAQQIDLAVFLQESYYAHGLTMPAIAEQLGVSTSTARNYLCATIPDFVSFRHRMAAFEHVRAAIKREFGIVNGHQNK